MSPEISVVIPAYGPTPHLSEALTAILGGTLKPCEIIVSHSGTDDPTDWIAGQFPNVTVLHSDARLFAGGARNRGAAEARGDILAFCDCDVLPATDWLEQIAKRMDGKADRFIIGSVGMARTGGYWGTANWLCEFSEMTEWRKEGPQTGGASCNMAVRTEHFRQVGGFDDGIAAGEDTILFIELRNIGLEQWFAPAAKVGHYNHSGVSAFLHHQYRLGEHFSKVRSLYPMRGASVVQHPVLATIAWAPKLLRVSRRTLEQGFAGVVRLIAYGPALLLGTVAHATGIFRSARSLQSSTNASTTIT